MRAFHLKSPFLNRNTFPSSALKPIKLRMRKSGSNYVAVIHRSSDGDDLTSPWALHSGAREQWIGDTPVLCHFGLLHRLCFDQAG